MWRAGLGGSRKRPWPQDSFLICGAAASAWAGLRPGPGASLRAGPGKARGGSAAGNVCAELRPPLCMGWRAGPRSVAGGRPPRDSPALASPRVWSGQCCPPLQRGAALRLPRSEVGLLEPWSVSLRPAPVAPGARTAPPPRSSGFFQRGALPLLRLTSDPPSKAGWGVLRQPRGRGSIWLQAKRGWGGAARRKSWPATCWGLLCASPRQRRVSGLYLPPQTRVLGAERGWQRVEVKQACEERAWPCTGGGMREESLGLRMGAAARGLPGWGRAAGRPALLPPPA